MYGAAVARFRVEDLVEVGSAQQGGDRFRSVSQVVIGFLIILDRLFRERELIYRHLLPGVIGLARIWIRKAIVGCSVRTEKSAIGKRAVGDAEVLSGKPMVSFCDRFAVSCCSNQRLPMPALVSS
jgi:hypothetical protein